MGIHVNSPGMLSTVQDLGRWGFQNLGVPVAGPMDRFSHRLANLLVGNSTSAAGLEITLLGPDIEFQDDVRCAVGFMIPGAASPGNCVVSHRGVGFRLR